MGTRSTQLIGLNERAEALLDAHGRSRKRLRHRIVGRKQLPDGTSEPYVRECWGPELEPEYTGREVDGMFGERCWELRRWCLPDGRVLVEDVQDEIWSAGPCIFLALRDEASGEWVSETLWSDEEMQAQI